MFKICQPLNSASSDQTELNTIPRGAADCRVDTTVTLLLTDRANLGFSYLNCY